MKIGVYFKHNKELLILIIMFKKLLLLCLYLNINNINSLTNDNFIFYIIDNDIKNISMNKQKNFSRKLINKNIAFPFIKAPSKNNNNKEKKRKSLRNGTRKKRNNLQYNLNYLPLNKTKY
tara:strand:+ start:149 stop:508 length:360 start_codon:yes stop_codon:yes gene_type:complete